MSKAVEGRQKYASFDDIADALHRGGPGDGRRRVRDQRRLLITVRPLAQRPNPFRKLAQASTAQPTPRQCRPRFPALHGDARRHPMAVRQSVPWRRQATPPERSRYVFESSLLVDSVTGLLEMELVEDRDYTAHSPLRYSAPHPGPLPDGRRIVDVNLTDLGDRGWMQCHYSVVIDVTSLADQIPENVASPWLTAIGAGIPGSWAQLLETTPYDVTETAPTTAGSPDSEDAEGDADVHVIEPLEAAFDPDSIPSTLSELATHALTGPNGYRLDKRNWRTACLLLAAAGRRDLADQVISRVADFPRASSDTADAIAEFARWLSAAEIPPGLTWSPADDPGELTLPAPPTPGEVLPSRAIWRRTPQRSTPEPVEVQELDVSFAGAYDLDMWLSAMSILELEFDIYDVPGAPGDILAPEQAPFVERQLLDTFPSWGHATNYRHRDLLDRYQRHLGELIRARHDATWTARYAGEGDILDPILTLADGRTVDPTEVIKHALTVRTGTTYTELLAELAGPASAGSGAPATIDSGDRAIEAVLGYSAANSLDYPRTGLEATPFSAGWSVFAPFVPDPNDPMSFLDTPVGRAVFYIGYDGRIEKYSSSLSPTECERLFLEGGGTN